MEYRYGTVPRSARYPCLDPRQALETQNNKADNNKFDVSIPRTRISQSCDSIRTLIEVLDLASLDIKQIVLDQVAAQVDALVADLPSQIEPVIEDAYDGLVISEELDLLGAPLSVTLWPDSLDITDQGLRAGYGAVVDTENGIGFVSPFCSSIRS